MNQMAQICEKMKEISQYWKELYNANSHFYEKPNTIERLKKFYDLNPDKKPQYIYVPKESKWNMSWLLPKLENMNYCMQETPMGYALEKIG